MQIHLGAIGTVGPKDVAKACKMKEMVMSQKGVGYVVANRSNINNYGV